MSPLLALWTAEDQDLDATAPVDAETLAGAGAIVEDVRRGPYGTLIAPKRALPTPRTPLRHAHRPLFRPYVPLKERYVPLEHPY